MFAFTVGHQKSDKGTNKMHIAIAGFDQILIRKFAPSWIQSILANLWRRNILCEWVPRLRSPSLTGLISTRSNIAVQVSWTPIDIFEEVSRPALSSHSIFALPFTSGINLHVRRLPYHYYHYTNIFYRPTCLFSVTAYDYLTVFFLVHRTIRAFIKRSAIICISKSTRLLGWCWRRKLSANVAPSRTNMRQTVRKYQ